MAGTLIPAPFIYFTDDEGNPLVDGTFETFITGTSTPTPVYHDADLADPWDNPATIPADGKAIIYMDANTIKMVVKDSDGNVLQTIDPIQSVALSGGGGSGGIAFDFDGDDDFPITVTALPSGTTLATLHPGTSILRIDSNDLIGDYGLQAMLQAGSGETVTGSLVNLSQGSPDTPLVSVTSSSTSGELQTSTVITFAAGGTARDYGIKSKTSVGSAPGYAYGFKLVRL